MKEELLKLVTEFIDTNLELINNINGSVDNSNDVIMGKLVRLSTEVQSENVEAAIELAIIAYLMDKH